MGLPSINNEAYKKSISNESLENLNKSIYKFREYHLNRTNNSHQNEITEKTISICKELIKNKNTDYSEKKDNINCFLKNTFQILKDDTEGWSGFFNEKFRNQFYLEVKDILSCLEQKGIFIEDKRVDEFTYTGVFTNVDMNLANGQGKRLSSSGILEEGEFESGRLIEGQINFPDGTFCEIETQKKENSSFECIIKKSSNPLFPPGNYQNKYPVIEADFDLNKKFAYTGLFARGLWGCNGEGERIHSLGFKEKGSFKDGKLIEGEIFFPDKTFCKIKDDRGECKIEESNNPYFPKGSFFKPTQPTSIKIGDVTYVGLISSNFHEVNGVGKCIYPSGITMEGLFDGKFIHGKITFPNNIFWEVMYYNPLYLIKNSNDPNSPKGFIFKLPVSEEDLKTNSYDSKKKEFKSVHSDVDYQRKLIFGFSTGQRININQLQIDINSNDLQKSLQGASSIWHMLYIEEYLNTEIEATKELCYKESLNQLKKDLANSIPFLIEVSLSKMNKKTDDFYFEQLCKNIHHKLTSEEMKSGDRLLIPVVTEVHETLLILEKGDKGEIIPTFYNTGKDMDECINPEKQLNIQLESSVASQLSKKKYEKLPISRKYPSINIQTSENNFTSMMREILQPKENKVSSVYKALEDTCGEPQMGKPRKIQLSGVCSFQCLSAAIKDILGRENFIDWKLGLFTRIQNDFRATVEKLAKTNNYNKTIAALDQLLLEDNQRAIEELKIKKEQISRNKSAPLT